MFGEDRVADLTRFLKAILTNQYAHWAPRRYVEFAGETGRGSEEESAQDIADYFRACFVEYFEQLNVAPDSLGAYLAGSRCLEYGPGDVPGVALLMYAHGAQKIYCVDRFPLLTWSPLNISVLENLLNGLALPLQERARKAFLSEGDPASGLDGSKIEYVVRPNGLSGLINEVDLVYSRAVLEHVNDLEATFKDMDAALVPGGVAIHLADLRSHGLHRKNPLDFLTWPASLWNAMYSYKGVPNRWRVDRYREALGATSLILDRIDAIERLPLNLVTEVRPHLAQPFQTVSDDDLAWLRFWLVAHKSGERAFGRKP